MTWLETTSSKFTNDSVLDALFNVYADPPIEKHERTKRHHSIQITEADDEAHAKKRERKELEQARWASLIDKELY